MESKIADLVSVMDKVDTSMATGKMLCGILGVRAEFNRRCAQERQTIRPFA